MVNQAWTPKERELAERLRDDMDFRAEFKADPKSAVVAVGNSVPPDFLDIRVVEDTEDVVHFVLPPNPNSQLSDEYLSAVSGGICNIGIMTWGITCAGPGRG